MDADGNFVVAWDSEGSAGTDTSGASTQARRFAADGTPLGQQFQVNEHTTGIQSTPAIAVAADGDFVIAWRSQGSFGSDTSSWSIQARRYAAGGMPLDGEFQVNDYTTSFQMDPELSADRAGDFVITWFSDGSFGSDQDAHSVQARAYRASGSPLGGQFQVNTYTTFAQLLPTVASNADGDFVIAWRGGGSSGTDTFGDSVHAQLYDELFRDGFEQGVTSRWHATVP
jgi:hypothetical protein